MESLDPGTHKVLFNPSEHLWQVWGLILNTILPLLLFVWASSLPLEVGYLVVEGSNILLSMVVQQQVVILKFLQEKMSTRPSSLPSCQMCEKITLVPLYLYLKRPEIVSQSVCFCLPPLLLHQCPSTSYHVKKPGRGPSPRVQPCWHLNFRLFASGNRRTECCSSHSISGTLLWQPELTRTDV